MLLLKLKPLLNLARVPVVLIDLSHMTFAASMLLFSKRVERLRRRKMDILLMASFKLVEHINCHNVT